MKLYQGEVPLFSHYQIESQIESAFQREVRLPSGGSIVIDVTEALTAIDINSARSTRGGDIEETALNTNLEAADEIARQLRLRDLGGLVVIDFIDMTPVRHQREVENRIRDAVRQDRARIQISRISRFGLLEMSRQRLSPSLGESSHHICPRCQGTGKVRDNESLSLSILRLIEEEALKENTKQVHTIVPVQIASYLLNEKRKAISNIEKRHNVDVIVAPNEAMETPHFSVFRLRDGEEVNELSYNLAKIHCEKDESTEESLVSRNVETTVVAAEQPAVESAAVALSISEAAPTPVERKSNEPSLLAKIIAKIKGLFASESEENKPKNNRTSRNSNRNQRRPQDRRTSRRPRSENNETERTEEQVRNIRERNQRRPRRNLVEESIAESAVNSTPVFEAQDEKTEQVTQRRQRRDLRKRVRVEDNEMAVENNESIIEQMPEMDVVSVQAVQDDEKPARQNQERSERQDRQRRTPRHLRAANNQRRRRNQEPKSPMPLFAAVASPELASGKAWVDYSTVNVQKENNFLSVDELLEQEKTKKRFYHASNGDCG